MTTNNILSLFRKNKEINELIEKAKNNKYNLFCNGMTFNHTILLASTLFKASNEFILLIFNNGYLANKAYDCLCDVIGYENINLYAVDDFVANEAIAISGELKQERINTIKNIISSNPKIIVTHIQALLKPTISLDNFKKNIIPLKVGEEINVNKLVDCLTKCGYIRTSVTYNVGEFSIRGEVIDIYPCCFDKPIRINMDFDNIEKIKYFNLETQLTLNETLDAVDIYPMNEIIIDFNVDEFKEQILKQDNSEYIKLDLSDIFDLGATDKLVKYIEYIDKESSFIGSYLNNPIVLLNEIKDIEENALVLEKEIFEYFNAKEHNKKVRFKYCNDYNDIIAYFRRAIYTSNNKKSIPNLPLIGLYELDGYKVIDYQNDVKMFVNDMKDRDELIFITFRDIKKLELVKSLFDENSISYHVIDDFFNVHKGINLILCDNGIGHGIRNFYYCITEDEIFKKVKKHRIKYRSVNESVIQITSKEDLKEGDYVVHYDYGIGRYIGIESKELNNVQNDYLKIQYENSNLLIPVEKITDLERYVGSEGVVPKLTKLGTNEWEKKKATVKKQLESIAKELIELQISREMMQGHKYQKDSEFQAQFESDFEFEETKDQERICKEIKADMEKGVLIDRLVCGDVGFGKTEIAMRAAFKAVYEGKQVAFMAPTTILTRQHFYTFKDRFEKYGVRVELLNRLVEERKQKEIIRDIKEGKIDIIIGTHRLLNDEISYKDLGLLIIDEEQRFGVVHKEKIKTLKTNVDVLTLTATPIPRTLQMAVSGIRQLSLLETPPKDRYPIQTYVVEYNDAIIKEAIYREIARGGQVFYLHNRVSDINLVAKKIKRLVPEGRICIGHGKMNRDELEDVISSFIDGEYNILVCTTIIETGIDIPNSNTLIVEDAYRLGLAQMYQIRGRVGRTDRIAYAYFTYQNDKSLTGAAEKRLKAIKEYTKIGSGYKIAVRDLAIRGAGDILGREQSGFINSLGIDMYMKLLNEAVDNAKGVKKEVKTNYRIEVSKHINKEYVSDDNIIIYIHKEINSIASKQDKERIINELTDRFGKLSQVVLDYIEERFLESQLRKINVEKVIETDNLGKVVIPYNISNAMNPEKILMTGYKLSDRIIIEYSNKQFIIGVKKSKSDRSWIYLLNEYFEKLF